jgi:hypothetical protein
MAFPTILVVLKMQTVVATGTRQAEILSGGTAPTTLDQVLGANEGEVYGNIDRPMNHSIEFAGNRITKTRQSMFVRRPSPTTPAGEPYANLFTLDMSLTFSLPGRMAGFFVATQLAGSLGGPGPALVTLYNRDTVGNGGAADKRIQVFLPENGVLLTHDSPVGSWFVQDEVVTGGTSGATGQIYFVNGTSSMDVRQLTGTFQNGEVLTGGTSGTTANTTAGPAVSDVIVGLTTPGAVNPSYGPIGNIRTTGTGVLFRNTIYWWSQQNTTGDIFVYDFANAAPALYTNVFANGGRLFQSSVDLVVHKNDLFALGVRGTDGGGAAAALAPYALKRLDGGSWTLVYTFDGTGGKLFRRSNAQDGGGPAMFTDPGSGDLVCWIPTAANDGLSEGFRVVRISDADTASGEDLDSAGITEITGTVLDAALAPGGSYSSQSRAQVVMDPDSLEIGIMTLPFPRTGSWQSWTWDDIDNSVTLEGTGPTWNYVLPHVRRSTGVRQPGMVSAVPTITGGGTEENGGLTTREFRLDGFGGVANLKLFFNVDEEEPEQELTLAGPLEVVQGTPQTTPTLNTSLNRIENVTPDSRVVYRVRQASTSSGIPGGAPYDLLMKVV